MSTAIKGMQRKPGGETYLFKASYFSTPNAGGYYTDQYGNFQHASTTATNRWTIKSNAGVDKFQVYFESGNTEVGGTLSVAGNADVKGNQVTIGDTNRTYAQVKFSTTNYTDGFIRAYDDGEYGQKMLIKPGGSLILGGGEFTSNAYSSNIDSCADAANEQTFIGSDSLLHFYSNGNTIANRKHWYMGNDGSLYLPDGTAKIAQDGNVYLNQASMQGWLSNLLAYRTAYPTYNSWYDADTMQSVSVPNATATTMGQVTLAAGLYLIILTAQWNTNATGYRMIWGATSDTGNAINVGSRSNVQAVAGALTVHQVIFPINATASYTLYIRVQQNSGAALNCSTRIHAIRLLAR